MGILFTRNMLHMVILCYTFLAMLICLGLKYHPFDVFLGHLHLANYFGHFTPSFLTDASDAN